MGRPPVVPVGLHQQRQLQGKAMLGAPPGARQGKPQQEVTRGLAGQAPRQLVQVLLPRAAEGAVVGLPGQQASLPLLQEDPEQPPEAPAAAAVPAAAAAAAAAAAEGVAAAASAAVVEARQRVVAWLPLVLKMVLLVVLPGCQLAAQVVKRQARAEGLQELAEPVLEAAAPWQSALLPLPLLPVQVLLRALLLAAALGAPALRR